MKKRNRETSALSLAFLDVICCGFGAIILLLMITKFGIPSVLEQSREQLLALLELRQAAIEEIFGETEKLERAKEETENDLDVEIQEIIKLQKELTELTSRFVSVLEISEIQSEEIEDLTRAKQTLSDEMIRLLGTDWRRQDRTIGGITVDSEYIVFVIDTSGSMRRYWTTVVQKFEEVLNIYPVVKGVQILNNDGEYMYPRHAGEWLKDTPDARRAIVDGLRGWPKQSISNPVPGIITAIDDFYDPNKRISLYIFGDDFSVQGGWTVEEVVDRIDAKNIADAEGNRRVRIHAVGFPIYLSIRQVNHILRYTNLMRELTVRNHGTFVGLPSIN